MAFKTIVIKSANIAELFPNAMGGKLVVGSDVLAGGAYVYETGLKSISGVMLKSKTANNITYTEAASTVTADTRKLTLAGTGTDGFDLWVIGESNT